MGVYVFESKHDKFIKVGHYKGENAWRRIAPKRGFNSTAYPEELRGKTAPTDFFLRFWFPDLGTKDEKNLHSKLKQWRVIGEWYEIGALSEISGLISSTNCIHLCNFEEAMTMTKFEDMVKILVQFQDNFENDRFFGNWMTTYSWGNDLARYSDEKFCTLTPRGKKTVTNIFKMLLDLLGVRDKGFKTMGEILVMAQYGEGVLKKWAATKSKQLGI